MRVTTFVRAERAVYVLVDRKPVSEHSSREEAKREAARLAAWVDGPDSEAARAGRAPDPTHTPAVRRVVAYDGGDGLVEDIEQAYLDAAVLIWERPSPSRRRACLRRHHLSNQECDAVHERLMSRLASLLRHRDEEAGHR